MSAASRLTLELSSNPDQLPGVRDTLRKWLDHHGWDSAEVADVVLAVDEALTNVIRHGYQGLRDQRIELTADLDSVAGPTPRVALRIRDFGRQVDPDSICGRDLDDLRPGGLGVHIIRSLMDEAVYSQAPGGGMELVMTRTQRTPPPATREEDAAS